MTVAKFVAGLSSGSLAVLSEAGHNLADVAATVMTYFAIRIANKPADENHHSVMPRWKPGGPHRNRVLFAGPPIF